MWTYWNLQEGEVAVDPLIFATADGGAPPVIHLDTDAPLVTDDGDALTDELWGIYFKRDRHACRAARRRSSSTATSCSTRTRQTTDIDPDFPDICCAALSHAMCRFEGCRALYKQARSGGVGAFTADNFPVFDYLRPNLYAVLDSNHGYKMIGVGREVARVLLGDHSRLLYPFRFERFETGDLHRSRARRIPGPEARRGGSLTAVESERRRGVDEADLDRVGLLRALIVLLGFAPCSCCSRWRSRCT